MAKQPRKTAGAKPKKASPIEVAPGVQVLPPGPLPIGSAHNTVEEVDRLVAYGRASRFIAFGDLHVNAQTLERCCRVLVRVGELGEEHDATIVCTGDFWDLRGTLNVRQLDAVLGVMERWERPAILIPGNHDQVTLDGMIHGMNAFRSLSNVAVVTEPVYHAGLLFLPWRENPAEQRAQFLLPPQSDGALTTIFGHAEVTGAIANSGKRTSGGVPLSLIETPFVRACYLGHYHKRQKLGDRTWYLSSPFQQNAGERDGPHGVALISTDQVDPTFIELDGFPKYWRLGLGDIEAGDVPDGMGAQDVVEVVAEADDIASERFAKAVGRLPTEDVRPRVAGSTAASTAPAFALTLEHALDAYVAEQAPEIAPEAVLAYGRDLLARVPEARRLAAFGKEVVLEALEIRDFCAIRGELKLSLPAGRVLLKGEVAVGKTAVIDAAMWCLYGATTPRKPGQSGATLRADAVINDAAASCEVTCWFAINGALVANVAREWDKTKTTPVREGSVRVGITRSKSRGAGAKVLFHGIDAPQGISDHQAMIESIVGLSQPLWRACVSLGQGAVSTFATDAQKRRTDLLSAAFGLEACPAAQKLARGQRDAAQEKLEGLLRQDADVRARIDVLERMDFAAQSAAWEQRHRAAIESLTSRGIELNATLENCGKVLADEPTWLASKAAHDARVVALTKQLSTARPAAKVAGLQRSFGAIEAEKAVSARDLDAARKKHAALVTSGAQNCETCGQPLPQVQREQHLHASEVAVRNLQVQVTTFEHKLANVAAELDQLNTAGSQDQQQVEAQIAESRDALRQCADALNQFTRVRANRESTAKELDRARADYRAEFALKNPHEEQARQCAEQLATLRSTLGALVTERDGQAVELVLSEFWVDAFGAKGIPVLVLRTALLDLESAANRYLARLLDGSLFCQLAMDEDDLVLSYFEVGRDGQKRERSYDELSGGQRRCVEISFAPFALGDLIYARTGVRVAFLGIDELTTHLGELQKRRACDLLEEVDRRTVLVVDHDPSVQGHFDIKWVMGFNAEGNSEVRAE